MDGGNLTPSTLMDRLSLPLPPPPTTTTGPSLRRGVVFTLVATAASASAVVVVVVVVVVVEVAHPTLRERLSLPFNGGLQENPSLSSSPSLDPSSQESLVPGRALEEKPSDPDVPKRIPTPAAPKDVEAVPPLCGLGTLTAEAEARVVLAGGVEVVPRERSVCRLWDVAWEPRVIGL